MTKYRMGVEPENSSPSEIYQVIFGVSAGLSPYQMRIPCANGKYDVEDSQPILIGLPLIEAVEVSVILLYESGLANDGKGGMNGRQVTLEKLIRSSLSR